MERLLNMLCQDSVRLKEEKRKTEIEKILKEETDGLKRFYNEIAPSEKLDDNFRRWSEHLAERLAQKYPDQKQREAAMQEAGLFASELPVRHSTIYENISKSSVPYISSEFMLSKLSSADSSFKTGTLPMDRSYELDHFVYCSLGIEDTTEERAEIVSMSQGKNISHDTQFFIKNRILKDNNTLVALEDYASHGAQRLWTQENLDKNSDAFDFHLQQIWRGNDFTKLFPMILAYAYDNPSDFNERKPFPLDLVPDKLPRLTDRRNNICFPDFEVRIPSRINPSDIEGIFIHPSAVQDKPVGKGVTITPVGLTASEERDFIMLKLKENRKQK